VRQGRQGEQITDYDNWKVFGGINMPTTMTSTAGGEKVGSGTVNAVDVNPAVDMKIFDKPASK